MDETIVDNGLNPEFYENTCRPTHTYTDENPLCGDSMTMDLRIENGIIEGAAFSGEMCMMSKAGANLLLKHVYNKQVEQVKDLTEKDVLAFVPPGAVGNRAGCYLFGLTVFKKTLEAKRNK